MPYIKRDANGRIDALYCEQSVDATEKLESSSSEIIEFLFSEASKSKYSAGDKLCIEDFYASDLGMARVIEDLIEILIAKNIVMITDLPEAAIHRIHSRKAMRQQFISYDDLLVGDDEIE